MPRMLKKINWIQGPAGYLSIRELPAPNTVRWTPRKKAEVVLAVNSGMISAVDACRQYQLTTEELLGWQSALVRDGIRGLRTTKPVCTT
jgi:transposase-like protein